MPNAIAYLDVSSGAGWERTLYAFLAEKQKRLSSKRSVDSYFSSPAPDARQGHVKIVFPCGVELVLPFGPRKSHFEDMRLIRRFLLLGALWHLLNAGGFILVIPYLVMKTIYDAVRGCYRAVVKKWFPEKYELAVHANVSSRSDWDSFGKGKRRTLTGYLRKALLEHVPDSARRPLDLFTWEERHSNYPGAEKDLVVYDQHNQPSYYGRSLAGGRITFWPA